MQVITAIEAGQVGEDSEDWVHADSNLVVVLDGATARTGTGCVHGVAWFVRQLGPAIARGASNTERSIAAAVADAIRHVASLHPTCDLAHPGTPSAAVGVLRLAEGAEYAEYFVLGDVSVVMDVDGEIVLVTDDRVSSTAAAERAEANRYPIGSAEKRAALLSMKHAELAARNRPGGYWVAETDPDAVNHALTGRTPQRGLRRFAVLTDGAARVVKFGLYDWQSALTLMQEHGPTELIRQVRAAERADPIGIRWPRNKQSDDAAVVFGMT